MKYGFGFRQFLAKAIGIKACNRYNVGYFHSEKLLESMVALKEQDYDKYARKMKKYLRWDLIILDDFLLHTITDEREIKILFELLEKRNEQKKGNQWYHGMKIHSGIDARTGYVHTISATSAYGFLSAAGWLCGPL